MLKVAKSSRTQGGNTRTTPARDHYEVMRIANRNATEKVVRLIEEFGRFAMPLLTDWSKCYIDVSGLPTPAQMMEHRKAITGDAVPGVQELRDALINQFETELGAIQAWNVLSSEERKGLRPPARDRKSLRSALRGVR